eukprot:TRINITY_DN4125_c0_g1_i1.p1 TRINITY_DN4125_c0_g1~~TRINITY_DN4125_c0_g1_i1.p1  ORF type:complete len:1074 (-),score=349.47 TRINITY_DN4125_c0_g1_i1:26-3247(-)
MTLREQGLGGECLLGLYSKTAGSSLGIYVKIPHYQGWLSRKKGGGISGKWVKQWYTLSRSDLSQFKTNKTGDVPLGSTPMKSASIVKLLSGGNNEVSSSQSSKCFELVTSARSTTFMCKTNSEVIRWVNALELSRRMYAVEAHLAFVPQRSNRASTVFQANPPTQAVSAPIPIATPDSSTADSGMIFDSPPILIDEDANICFSTTPETKESPTAVSSLPEAKKAAPPTGKASGAIRNILRGKASGAAAAPAITNTPPATPAPSTSPTLANSLPASAPRSSLSSTSAGKQLLNKRCSAEHSLQESDSASGSANDAPASPASKACAGRAFPAPSPPPRPLSVSQPPQVHPPRPPSPQESVSEIDLDVTYEVPDTAPLSKNKISLKTKPELAYLLPIEILEQTHQRILEETVTPQELVLSWVKYHLERARGSLSGYPINTPASLANGFQDGKVLCAVLNQLDPEICSLAPLKQSDTSDRLKSLEGFIEELGVEVEEDFSLEQALNDEEKLLVLLSEVLNQFPGLDVLYSEVVSKRESTCNYINWIFEKAPHPGVNSLLPLSSHFIPQYARTGIFVSRILNAAFGNVIDERMLFHSSGISKSQLATNWRICLSAALSLGVLAPPPESLSSTEIGSNNMTHSLTDLSMSQSGSQTNSSAWFPLVMAGKPNAIHEIVWAVVEGCLSCHVSLKRTPKISQLGAATTKRAILLRWCNYHLKKSTKRSISNFNVDIENSENLYYLLKELAPDSITRDLLEIDDWNKRAEYVISACVKLGCCPLISARAIVESDNEEVTMAFLADLFHVVNGLPELPQSSNTIQDKQDNKVSNEKKQEQEELIEWVKSLCIDSSFEKMPEDYLDGTAFMKIIIKAVPGAESSVDPKRINFSPGNGIFKRSEFLNYIVAFVQKISPRNKPMQGIFGGKIAEGNVQQTIALLSHIKKLCVADQPKELSQSVRGKKTGNEKNALEMFRLARLRSVTNEDVISWINNQCEIATKPEVDLLTVLALLQKLTGKVNQDLVTPNKTERDVLRNARYITTIAWFHEIEFQVLPQELASDQKSVLSFLSGLFIHYTMKAKSR